MNKLTNKQKKKIMMVLGGILVFILVFLLAFALFSKDKNKKEDSTPDIQANTNEDIIKDYEVDGFRFSRTALVIEYGQSKLTTEVKNLTDEDIELKSFNIILKDKNGNEMVTLLGYVGEVIKAGETKSIISQTDVDLTNATGIEYSINY